MPHFVTVNRYVGALGVAAACCFAMAAVYYKFTHVGEFLCYLAIALLASSLKVTLPGIDGTMSVNFVFILLGILELTFTETLVLGAASVLVQCYWRPANPLKLIQVVFNISQLALASTAAFCTFQALLYYGFSQQRPLALAGAAIVYFLCNTVAMAMVISLSSSLSSGLAAHKIWLTSYMWSFPYYLIGAAIAAFVSYMTRQVGWATSILTVPVIYVIYRSYRLHLNKLQDETLHAQEMSRLHLRTIEALALAIEAKDHTTHDHLQRVRVYAMGVAEELGLEQQEIEALTAASLLHDIGKLAVPEHIISKPGKLTQEEFDRMKIHPIIGAEILDQVGFPYPVVPVVRSHHEKWDGSGYPDGLKGEQIPIGARILSAVDCLDALASHRQYRPALPLHEAMSKVAAESGISFDPRVVEVLQKKYIHLEELAREKGQQNQAHLSVGIKVERGAAPAAGFQTDSDAKLPPRMGGCNEEYTSSIADARQEARVLFELSHDLGTSLSLDDTLSMFSVRIKRLVSYDAMAVYVRYGTVLTAEYVSGDNFRLFSSLKIPIGEGLSGWVAHNHKPIINGNPSVEPGYLNDPTKFSTLRSALAVPLEGHTEVVAVLALYRSDADAFTQDDLRITLSASSKLGFTIDNALKFRKAETSATTDFLTGLPNSRSLYMHLEAELSRSRRSGTLLTVFVLDLDGFKQVNDRFGHVEGNNLLRMFAAALKDSCREYDYAARIGGDEFVIVAPGLQVDAVKEMTLRLEEMAVQVGLAICGEGVLAVSVGHASYTGDGQDAEAVLSAADRSMYEMKKGRATKAAALADVRRDDRALKGSHV